MGVHNNFSPPGTSSYELKNLTGCFSYMTAEQLCNWSLLAATYVLKTGDLALGAAEPARAGGVREQPGQPRRRNRIRPLRLVPLRKRRRNHHLRFAGQFPGADPEQRLYGRQMLGQLSRPGAWCWKNSRFPAPKPPAKKWRRSSAICKRRAERRRHLSRRL